jgi:hypothetical protein
LYFAPGDAEEICENMKRKANDLQLKSALCIVCVFGQTSVSNDGEYAYDASMMSKLEKGENVAAVLRLPRDDRFGLTDVFLEMTAPSMESELLSTHSFLRASGQKLEAKDAVGWFDVSNPSEAVMDFQELMNDLEKE